MDLAEHVPEGAARDFYIKVMKSYEATFNEHSYQMYNIFAQFTFKQITECHDMYVLITFAQSRAAWLFKLDDVDFLKFYQDEIVPVKEKLKDPFDDEIIALIESHLSSNYNIKNC